VFFTSTPLFAVWAWNAVGFVMLLSVVVVLLTTIVWTAAAATFVLSQNMLWIIVACSLDLEAICIEFFTYIVLVLVWIAQVVVQVKGVVLWHVSRDVLDFVSFNASHCGRLVEVEHEFLPAAGLQGVGVLGVEDEVGVVALAEVDWGPVLHAAVDDLHAAHVVGVGAAAPVGVFKLVTEARLALDQQHEHQPLRALKQDPQCEPFSVIANARIVEVVREEILLENENKGRDLHEEVH